MKSWLEKDYIEMYPGHNEGKSVIDERFIRTLKNNIYRYMKLAGAKSSTYIDYRKEISNKEPKFKIGDIVKISKYENTFAKSHTPNWSQKAFVIKKVKSTVPCTYVISDLNGEKMLKKGDKLYVKRNGYDSSYNSCINKKDLV